MLPIILIQTKSPETLFGAFCIGSFQPIYLAVRTACFEFDNAASDSLSIFTGGVPLSVDGGGHAVHIPL